MLQQTLCALHYQPTTAPYCTQHKQQWRRNKPELLVLQAAPAAATPKAQLHAVLAHATHKTASAPHIQQAGKALYHHASSFNTLCSAATSSIPTPTA
jgi:hypothetical protein